MKVHLIEADEQEAERLSRELQDAGHVVATTPAGAAGGTAAESPPDVVLVSLGRAGDASLARLGELLGERWLCAAPLLFIGSDGDALTRARELHPGASFARTDQMHPSLASLSA